jgi:aspartokinase
LAINITKIVKDIIDNDLSFQDALNRGYANISAIARIIKPKVDTIVGHEINIESIITALKRLKIEYTLPKDDTQNIIANSKIILKTDVAKISVIKNKSVIEKISKPLADHYDSFISVSQGANSITMIFDRLILEKMKVLFIEDTLEVEDGLAAIIVQSPESIIKTPGCALIFYNQLARRHINIEDTISCYTDTIILVNMNDIAKAFNTLNDLVREARNYTK